MTEYLFRDDPYARTAEAVVTASGPEGFELDRTIFYAASGGQAGDTGSVAHAAGRPASATPSTPMATAAASSTSSPPAMPPPPSARPSRSPSTGSAATG